jgi:hypothetical protein
VKNLLSTTHKPTKGEFNARVNVTQKVIENSCFSDGNVGAIEVILQKIKL